MAQDVLGLGVKLYDIAIDRLLERVPDQCLVFVVLDAYSVRPLLAAIVRPGQKAGYHVLGPLQPFKADDGDCRRFWPTFVDAAPREFVDLLASNGVLFALSAALEREVVPGIRMLFVKQIRMESPHDAPDLAAEPDHFLALPQPEPVRTVDNLVIDLSAARGVSSLICRSPMRRPLLPTVSHINCIIRS